MNESKISVRYAKALFQAALESGLLDDIHKDVLLLEESMESEEFRAILESPVVKTSKKINLVRDVFSNYLKKLSLDFLVLVLRNKRESHLHGIIRNFESLYKAEKGIKSAELHTPAKVSEEQKQKFTDLLKKVYNSRIELKEHLNPALIGGFILKVEDEQFDASVSTSLARIKKELVETSIEK